MRRGPRQDHPANASFLRGRDGCQRRAVVRGEDLLVARLVHASDEVHDGVHARQDLDQLVGLLDREHGDLRAERRGAASAASGRRTVARTSSRRAKAARSPVRGARGAVTITVMLRRCYRCPRRQVLPTAAATLRMMQPERRRHRTGAPCPRRAPVRGAPGRGTAPRRTALRRSISRAVGRLAKVAAFDYTAEWLRRIRDLRGPDGQPFLPRLLGWDDDGTAPALVLEDLSGATWPRRGTPLASTPSLPRIESPLTPPPEATPAGERQFGQEGGRPSPRSEPFLTLGLCSAGWLTDHLRCLRTRRPRPTSGDLPAALRRAERQPLPARQPAPARRLEQCVGATPCWTWPPGSRR